MKHFRHFLFAFVALALFSGCASATKEYSKRLRGTWQIVNYDVQRPVAYSTNSRGNQSFGSITFNKDGSGYTDNASIFDNMTSAYRQQQNQYYFSWTNTENVVVFKAQNSNVSKSWIVVTNKKGEQIWKTTDGANEVKTLELKR